jgi:ABC-2 type transport system ATP-binding protein
MPSPLVSLRNASVRLGPQPLFTALGVAVTDGDRICLVGRNGAGKSTLLTALAGLIELDQGERLQRVRTTVAYLPQEPRLDPGLSALDATLSGLQGTDGTELAPHRAAALLDRFQLDSRRRIAELSGGEARRVDLARVLLREPDVLLLDEPTDGVDPVGRREIRDLLKAEASKGRAILLNSHLLSEIELTCDRVAVLRNGRVAARGTIDELTKREEKKDSLKVYRLVASGVDDAVLAALRETGAGAERVNGHFQLSARDPQHLNALIDAARARGALLTELTPEKTTLEDVFVDLVKATPDA